MARNQYRRYHNEYRGRRRSGGGSTALKVIIIILALVLLAFLALTVFMGGRIEYTDDGVRVVLPWTEQQPEQPEEPEDPVTDDPPVFVVDEPEEPSPDPAQTPSQEPSPEVSVPKTIGAVEVSRESLLDGTAASLVEEAGGNTLVVEMKAASGKVYWDSRAALPDVQHHHFAHINVKCLFTIKSDGKRIIHLGERYSHFHYSTSSSRHAHTVAFIG